MSFLMEHRKNKVEKIQNDIDKIQAKVEEVKQKHSTILSSAQTDDSKWYGWLAIGSN